MKDFLLARHGPSTTRERLQHYLEFMHAPLALSVPAVAREVRRYTMNHADEGTAEDVRLYPPIPEIATVVEHVFGAGIERVIAADAQYLAQVRPDENYMIETLMDGAPQFVAVDEELPIFTSDRPGSVRMFDFVRAPAEVSRTEFLEKLAEDGAWASADAHYRSAIGRRVHNIVSAGPPDSGVDAEPFDAVIENWITDPSALAPLMDEQRRRRALFCDPGRCFTAVTEEHWLRGDADAFGPRLRHAAAHAE